MKSMKCLIRKQIQNYSYFFSTLIQIDSGNIITFDVMKQITLILQTHFTSIVKYRNLLKKTDNGDVLY